MLLGLGHVTVEIEQLISRYVDMSVIVIGVGNRMVSIASWNKYALRKPLEITQIAQATQAILLLCRLFCESADDVPLMCLHLTNQYTLMVSRDFSQES